MSFTKKSFFILIVALFLLPVFVLAEEEKGHCDGFNEGDPYGVECGAASGLSESDPRTITAKIINIGLGLLGIIALVLVVYAGFKYMTSGGNEEETGKAKKILMYAVIGLAIILSSYTISRFILGQLNKATEPSHERSPYGVRSTS